MHIHLHAVAGWILVAYHALAGRILFAYGPGVEIYFYLLFNLVYWLPMVQGVEMYFYLLFNLVMHIHRHATSNAE